jgi:hypothetical protein
MLSNIAFLNCNNFILFRFDAAGNSPYPPPATGGINSGETNFAGYLFDSKMFHFDANIYVFSIASSSSLRSVVAKKMK